MGNVKAWVIILRFIRVHFIRVPQLGIKTFYGLSDVVHPPFCRKFWSLYLLLLSKLASSVSCLWPAHTRSMTRFGKIYPLWHNFKSIGLIFVGLFIIWQNFNTTVAKMFFYWASFHCCRRSITIQFSELSDLVHCGF